jgi:catechol 2,3-dioxygenase-like lactoylglutathione lyase family enzyme
LDHVGIVVDDLPAAIAFFLELGLELQGETTVEGGWVDQLLGLEGVRSDIAFLRSPEGGSLVELSTFHSPTTATPAPRAPLNVPGIPRLIFVVEDVGDLVARLRPHDGHLLGEIVQVEDVYLYGNVRGPEGVIIGLVQELRST